MSSELLKRVKDSKENIEETATECIIEALKHLRDFCFRGEVWSRDEVADVCYEIGELLYENGGMEALQSVYYEVRAEMKGVAARYLEHFWDGVGNGAWRG